MRQDLGVPCTGARKRNKTYVQLSKCSVLLKLAFFVFVAILTHSPSSLHFSLNLDACLNLCVIQQVTFSFYYLEAVSQLRGHSKPGFFELPQNSLSGPYGVVVVCPVSCVFIRR